MLYILGATAVMVTVVSFGFIFGIKYLIKKNSKYSN